MLEKMIIGVLLCIVAMQFIFLKVMWRRVREAEKARDSWKLAAEHWEKQATWW